MISTLIRFIQKNLKFNLKSIFIIKFIDLLINIIGQGGLLTNKHILRYLFNSIKILFENLFIKIYFNYIK